MSEQNQEFLEACKPLMKYLSENYHPHTTVIVTATEAELMEGVQSVVTEEFLVD